MAAVQIAKPAAVYVVVDFLYCPYAQSISCGEDINAETDECKYFLVDNIDVETQWTVKDVGQHWPENET